MGHTCINCGESLIGDGYSYVLECPNIKTYSDFITTAAPDEGPFYCEGD